MAGHNKWSKIKHKKALTDAKKSKVFSKFVKLIQVESKKAGGNTDSPGLRAAIDKAKAENMPSDNIDRAVAKGKADTGADMDHLIFETYGPGGSAVIIEALTDNHNRTAPEIKHILTKRGLQLAAQHSATWAFDKVEGGGWQAKMPHEISEEDLEKLEGLIEELEDHEDVQGVYTNV